MYKLRERYILFQNRLEKEIHNAKIIKKFNLNSSYTADAIHPSPSAHKIIKNIILKDMGELKSKSILDEMRQIFLKGKTYSNPKSSIKPYDSDVEYIQTALQHLGFFLPKWGIDGKFGEETEKAVKDFQAENNLAVSGSLNKEDLEVMTDELKYELKYV
jgi:hypothetical protein